MSSSTASNLHTSTHREVVLHVSYEDEDFYVEWPPSAARGDIAKAMYEAAVLGFSPDTHEASTNGDNLRVPLYFADLDSLDIHERQAHYERRMTKGLDWQS